MRADDEHRWFVFVSRDVVGNLEREEVAALGGRRRAVGGRNVDDLRDRGIGSRNLLHSRDDAIERAIGRGYDVGAREQRGSSRCARRLFCRKRTAQRPRAIDERDFVALTCERLPLRWCDREFDGLLIGRGPDHVVTGARELRLQRRQIRAMNPDANARLLAGLRAGVA